MLCKTKFTDERKQSPPFSYLVSKIISYYKVRVFLDSPRIIKVRMLRYGKIVGNRNRRLFILTSS